MLLLSDAARDEDPQVPDLLVHHINDGLPTDQNVILILVQIQNPSEGLLGRRDVVAF